MSDRAINTDKNETVGEIVDEKVNKYVHKVLRCWIPDINKLSDLWWLAYIEVQNNYTYSNFRSEERQALWRVLNDLMNEGGKTTGRNVVQAIDNRIKQYKKHIRTILENSKADYDNI